jgi:ribosomal protein S18 acetylase RimI-like enzyme
MLTIRAATAADAAQIVNMVGLLCLHEGKPLPDFAVDDFLRDCLGPQPAFSTLVAESDGKLAGYVSYYAGYDLETAKRGCHIADLFVHSGERGTGIGRKLVAAVAKDCKNNGGNWVQWFCQKTNDLAFDFYTHVGGSLENDAVSFCLTGARFQTLTDDKP